MESSPGVARPAAAYGLRIHGIPQTSLAVLHAPDEWREVRVRQTQEEHQPVEYIVAGKSVVVPLVTGGRLDLEGEALTAHFRVPAPLPVDDLLHPYFAPAAAWFSYWLDRHCFHAGAVVVQDKAYAVLGGKEAGKSSLLAWLAGAGVPVLADDLVVVAGSSVLTGPRSIDLRLPTVEALPEPTVRAMVRGGTRHRMRLPQTAHEWPLGGWIFVTWGEGLSVRTIPPRERLTRLGQHRIYRGPIREPRDALAFAALPAWEVTRPRRWDAMDDVIDLLATTLSA